MLKKIYKLSLVASCLTMSAVAHSEVVTFSRGLEWNNTGEIDWQLNTGGTPSTGTGPESGNGQYIYFETSSGFANVAGQHAILTSPFIKIDREDFTFMYHMYGADIGTLSVSVLDGSRWINLGELTGQREQQSSTDQWEQADFDVSEYIGRTTKIRIEASAKGGYRGDIAIDTISYDYLGVPTTSTVTINNNASYDDTNLPDSATVTIEGQTCYFDNSVDSCTLTFEGLDGIYDATFGVDGDYGEFEWESGCDSVVVSKCRLELYGGSSHVIEFDITEQEDDDYE